jgi:hypothetical protein
MDANGNQKIHHRDTEHTKRRTADGRRFTRIISASVTVHEKAGSRKSSVDAYFLLQSAAKGNLDADRLRLAKVPKPNQGIPSICVHLRPSAVVSPVRRTSIRVHSCPFAVSFRRPFAVNKGCVDGSVAGC